MNLLRRVLNKLIVDQMSSVNINAIFNERLSGPADFHDIVHSWLSYGVRDVVDVHVQCLLLRLNFYCWLHGEVCLEAY